MRRRRKIDIYLTIGIFIIAACYFAYNYHYSESRGVAYYAEALKPYKDGDFTTAYNEFAKIPYASTLKQPALFRQARCATNLGQKELAIKKYKKIVKSKSKSSIVPISAYYMASLMYETEDNNAKKTFEEGNTKNYEKLKLRIFKIYIKELVSFHIVEKNKLIKIILIFF